MSLAEFLLLFDLKIKDQNSAILTLINLKFGYDKNQYR